MVSQLHDMLNYTGLHTSKGAVLWYVNSISVESCMRKAKSTATDAWTQTGSLVRCGPDGALLDQHSEGFANTLLSAGRGNHTTIRTQSVPSAQKAPPVPSQ